MIGFTGARVIEQTLRVKLPEGFQEAEFLLSHGQVDKVVARKDLRATLAQLLSYAEGASTGAPVQPVTPAVPALPVAPVDVPVASAKTNRPHAIRKRSQPRAAPRRRN
jgi:hypothetical protein